jgi:hypothetical protein
VFDNYALYFGSEPIKMANGYLSANDGKLYAYENGKKLPNSISADGILKSDENGALKIGSSYVYSLSDFYVYLGSDLVLKDGIYSGFYRANSFTGKTDGNLYYYDSNKIRVAYKISYDVKNGSVAGSGEATGYSFNGYGVATPLNGIYAFEDGSRYYVNGIRQTGLFTVGGKTYSANSKGYLSLSPVAAGNGSYYFFDANTYEGSVLSVGNGVIANINQKTSYASFEDAIANASDGQTLTLINDLKLTDVVLFANNKNITLDLNGKVLTANSLTVIGGVTLTDSGDTKGLIKVPKSSIATSEISSDRISMGYEDMNTKYDFVVRAYEDEERAIDIAKNFDV